MPTKLFVSASYMERTLCLAQAWFGASSDFRVQVMTDFELKPLCTLDEFRSAYATLAVLLAALALHNSKLKGSIPEWELTLHREVLEYCTEDELLSWARLDDSAMAVLMSHEISAGYWDGRLRGLKQSDLVYSAMTHLGSFAFCTNDMPLIRAADKAGSATQKRLSEAVFLYKSKHGSLPANLPLIEKLLDAISVAQAVIVLR